MSKKKFVDGKIVSKTFQINIWKEDGDFLLEITKNDSDSTFFKVESREQADDFFNQLVQKADQELEEIWSLPSNDDRFYDFVSYLGSWKIVEQSEETDGLGTKTHSVYCNGKTHIAGYMHGRVTLEEYLRGEYNGDYNISEYDCDCGIWVVTFNPGTLEVSSPEFYGEDDDTTFQDMKPSPHSTVVTFATKEEAEKFYRETVEEFSKVEKFN